jgi:hypothetical protein
MAATWPIRTNLSLAAVIIVSAATVPHAAIACSFVYGAGWTATGGGTPGQLTVLGGETCTGVVHGNGVSIIAPPQHGKVKLTGPSSYAYTPNRAYRGPDTFKVSAAAANGSLVIGSIEITIY